MAELDARRAEVLGNAASIIQRKIRTHIARQQLFALNNASVFLQSFCRCNYLTYFMSSFNTNNARAWSLYFKLFNVWLLGRLACKKFEQLKRTAAAIKIEKHVRKWRKWVAYTRLRVSVLAVQTCLRAIEGRKRYRYRKETNAAIKIQVKIN